MSDDLERQELEALIARQRAELHIDWQTGLKNQKAFRDDLRMRWPLVGVLYVDHIWNCIRNEPASVRDAFYLALGAELAKREEDGVRIYHFHDEEFVIRLRSPELAAQHLSEIKEWLCSLELRFQCEGNDHLHQGVPCRVGLAGDYESAYRKAIRSPV